MAMDRSLWILRDVTFKMATWQPYCIFLCPDSNFSLALNINSKLQWHNTSVNEKELIDFQQRHFQNGRLVAILDFSVSGLCRWHGFRSVTKVCFGISVSNSKCMSFVAMDSSPIIFTKKSLTKWPGDRIGFFGFRTLTLVWLWISSPNFNSTFLVYMGMSLPIFSDVIFKMAAWWPYWIFGFRTPTLDWLWISTANFSSTILLDMYIRHPHRLIICSSVRFK